MAPDELQDLARRAYERGRLHRAIPWMVPALTVGGVLVYLGLGTWSVFAVLAAVLAVWMMWRGEGWARGVPVGLIAGTVGAIVPVAFACGSHGCVSACELQCLLATAVAGAAGGLLFASFNDWRSAASALGLASVLAMAGCLTLGAGGLVGIAALVIVAAPATALGVPART